MTRGIRIARASTLAHEMAHQWFGNLVTPAWWDDLWLNESFAEYLGNRVTADVTEYADVWVDNSYARRQWGLVADQRPSTHPVAGNGAVDASAALQDFDGISYAKGCAILRQLNATVGDDVFFKGAIDHFERHRFGNATMHDLFASWERAGAGDLSSFTDNWLRTAGPDRIELDRAAGVVRRTPPADHPADRPHRIRAAVASEDGTWTDQVLDLEGPETPFDAGDRPVLLDPYNDTWALLIPDKLTMDALETLLPQVQDPELRAGVWSNIRSALHNAAVDPVDVLEVAVRSLPIEDTEDTPAAHDGVGLHLGRAAAARPGLRPLPAARRRARQARRSGARLRTAARGVPRGHRHVVRPGPPAGVASTGGPPGGRAARPRPALAGRWCSSPRSARSTSAELDRQLEAEPTAVARVRHAAARASLPDAEAKAWAWGCFTGETEPAQLRARGRGPRHVARRPAGAHGAVRRALLRRPARHRQGAQRLGARRGRRGLLPADLADPGDPRAGRGAHLRRRPGPVHASPAGRRGGRPAAQARGARGLPAPMTPPTAGPSSRGRRPGPMVRTRVHEHGTERDRRHEDRLATEEPLEIRLAWPGAPPRRVWVTMRTPGHDFELAAGWLVHEGLTTAPPHTIAYCTDADLTPEQEFNVVTVTLDVPPTRDPGHRHAGSGSSACGVCGKDTIAEALAAPAAGRWAGPVPGPDVVRTLPDRLREAQSVFDATGGVHAAALATAEGALLVVREDVGRHNAVDKVTGARVVAGLSPSEAALVVSGRAGFELVQKAVAAGVGALVAVGAPTSLAVHLAEEAGLVLYGFTSAGAHRALRLIATSSS